jgi:hypothetical protein
MNPHINLRQDFGPKANFKKQKIKAAGFNGFPPYAEYVLHRLAAVPEASVCLYVCLSVCL